MDSQRPVLRVGMNAFFLSRPRTGSGQYLQHLLDAAPRQAIQYVLWSYGPNLPVQPTATPVRLLQVPAPVRAENLAKPWFEQIGLPAAARNTQPRLDLLHYPYWASPLRKQHMPVVVTIHDVIPALLPAYRGSIPVRLYTTLVSRAAHNAGQIIADSACSKRDIVRLLGIPANRVHVVYLAAEARYRPFEPSAADRIALLRHRFAIGERYVFYIGGFDVRKNVPVLVRAFAETLLKLRQAGDTGTCQLVIAGDLAQTGSSFFPDPRPQAESLGLIAGKDIIFPGPISDDEKADLLAAATVFAFPSQYEGFGLPPLEAMASGAPVVCSNGGSLPEIVGDAAITHDPVDIRVLATGLFDLLHDPALQAELKMRGLAQAEKFSWSRCAAETRAVYDIACKVK